MKMSVFGHASAIPHQRPGQKISDPQSGFQLQLIPVDLNRVPPIILQTFFVVAEVGQISEAARHLHLSQRFLGLFPVAN
jgi:hypothetical protein